MSTSKTSAVPVSVSSGHMTARNTGNDDTGFPCWSINRPWRTPSPGDGSGAWGARTSGSGPGSSARTVGLPSVGVDVLLTRTVAVAIGDSAGEGVARRHEHAKDAVTRHTEARTALPLRLAIASSCPHYRVVTHGSHARSMHETTRGCRTVTQPSPIAQGLGSERLTQN